MPIAARIEGEVQQRGDLGGIDHAVGHLPLEADLLEIGGGFREHERRVVAGHRHRDQTRRRRIIVERQSEPLTLEPAILVLQKVRGWLDLDETQSEHGSEGSAPAAKRRICACGVQRFYSTLSSALARVVSGNFISSFPLSAWISSMSRRFNDRNGREMNCSRSRGRGTGFSMVSTIRPGCAPHHEDAVGQIGSLVQIVRDEQDRHVHAFPDLQQVALHLRAGLGVKRAEGFVHDEDARFVGQRTRDGHALFHTAGEFVGVRFGELIQAHEVEPLQRRGIRFPGGFAAGLQPEHHVALDREPREQRVTLKHHPAVGSRPLDLLTVQEDLAAGGLVESGDDADQRRFAAARRADDAQKLPAAHLETQPVEHGRFCLATTERFFQTVDVQDHGPFAETRETCRHPGRLFTVVRQQVADRDGLRVGGQRAHRRTVFFLNIGTAPTRGAGAW